MSDISRNNQRRQFLLALPFALAACAENPVAKRSLSFRMLDSVMSRGAHGYAIAVRVVPGEVAVGNVVAIEVSTSKAGHLYVLHIGTASTHASLLFPNDSDPYTLVPVGTTKLPRASWRISVRGPAGAGYIAALVAKDEQSVPKLKADIESGELNVSGEYGAALISYREFLLGSS